VDASFLTGCEEGRLQLFEGGVEPGAGSGHALPHQGPRGRTQSRLQGARMGVGFGAARRRAPAKPLHGRGGGGGTRARCSSASPTRRGRDRAGASVAGIP
jgi:hypothetical protein